MRPTCPSDVAPGAIADPGCPAEPMSVPETLSAADLTNRKTDDAGHNQRPTEEILVGFRKARGKLLETASELDPAVYSKTALHPRLKTPMRLVDHLYFVAEHDDHHLACIWALIKRSTI